MSRYERGSTFPDWANKTVEPDVKHVEMMLRVWPRDAEQQ